MTIASQRGESKRVQAEQVHALKLSLLLWITLRRRDRRASYLKWNTISISPHSYSKERRQLLLSTRPATMPLHPLPH